MGMRRFGDCPNTEIHVVYPAEFDEKDPLREQRANTLKLLRDLNGNGSPKALGQFVQALTVKLVMYALGREIAPQDMPQVRAIVREAAKNNYRFSSLVAGIVSSDAFRMQAQEE